ILAAGQTQLTAWLACARSGIAQEVGVASVSRAAGLARPAAWAVTTGAIERRLGRQLVRDCIHRAVDWTPILCRIVDRARVGSVAGCVHRAVLQRFGVCLGLSKWDRVLATVACGL